ncbi:MAG TPA: ATP-binding protein, partial [Gemmatimonadaceae bacterium]|nr:ATP-binding protein [Gemmatimonadaceae bacterium]
MPPVPSPAPLPALARRLSSPVAVVPDERRPRPITRERVAVLGVGAGASITAALALHERPLVALGTAVVGVLCVAVLGASAFRARRFVDMRRHERERGSAHASRVALLLESARALTEQGSEAGVYEQLRRHAAAVVPNDEFTLAIFDDKGVLAGRYSAAGIIDGLNALPTERELAVVRSGTALLATDDRVVPLDLASGKTSVALDHVHDAYIPVNAGRALVGVVTVRRAHAGYCAEELDALAALCQQAGIAIGRARLFMQVLSAKREWERVFDATAEGLALIDAEGRIRRCNAAFAAFAGTSFGSAVGQHHHRVGNLELGQGDHCVICRAIRGGRRGEHVIESPDGHILRVTLSPYPMGGVVLVAQDVTAESEMRAAQHQLFESEKFAAIGRLAAGVAHEVNNPLMGITSLATVVLEDASLAGENRDMVTMIQRESRRAAQVTRDLLSFVRVDDHQRAEVDLNDVAREVAELRAVQQRASNIVMTLDLAPDMPRALLSRAQILQVVINLVTNAEDAVEGRDRREVRISTYHGSGSVALRVEDSGPGIPEELKARLFEPFFTTKAPGKGT